MDLITYNHLLLNKLAASPTSIDTQKYDANKEYITDVATNIGSTAGGAIVGREYGKRADRKAAELALKTAKFPNKSDAKYTPKVAQVADFMQGQQKIHPDVLPYLSGTGLEPAKLTGMQDLRHKLIEQLLPIDHIQGLGTNFKNVTTGKYLPLYQALKGINSKHISMPVNPSVFNSIDDANNIVNALNEFSKQRSNAPIDWTDSSKNTALIDYDTNYKNIADAATVKAQKQNQVYKELAEKAYKKDYAKALPKQWRRWAYPLITAPLAGLTSYIATNTPASSELNQALNKDEQIQDTVNVLKNTKF